MISLYETLLIHRGAEMEQFLPNGKKGNWPQILYENILTVNGWIQPSVEQDCTPITCDNTAYEITLNDGSMAGLVIYYESGVPTEINIFRLPSDYKSIRQ